MKRTKLGCTSSAWTQEPSRPHLGPGQLRCLDTGMLSTVLFLKALILYVLMNTNWLFLVYSFMNFNACRDLNHHHQNKDAEQLCHFPPKSLLLS